MGTTSPNMLTINHRFFFNTIRKSFGPLRQAQVDGFNVLLTAIEDRLSSIPEAAYLLATAWHETAFTMQPVRETLASSDEDAIARLEFAWARGRLTWVKTPYWQKDSDGKSWLGRGYVQLTHKVNYERMGERLGVDLVERPELAMVPSIAADILIVGCQEGLFTGRKLSEFVGVGKQEYIQARRVINGLDRAKQIAEYARGFEKAIRV
jgi:predicted chitinase